MYYTINNSTIYDLIDEEISRVAATEYDDGASSLYDAVTLHSGDRNEIARLQGDAVNVIVVRLHDIVTILPDDTDGNHRLEFFVPDMEPSSEDAARTELDMFIALNVTAAWLQSRAADRAPEFTARGQVSLDKASTILHTRRKPQRI